jgi:hypothetical protein
MEERRSVQIDTAVRPLRCSRVALLSWASAKTFFGRFPFDFAEYAFYSLLE